MDETLLKTSSSFYTATTNNDLKKTELSLYKGIFLFVECMGRFLMILCPLLVVGNCIICKTSLLHIGFFNCKGFIDWFPSFINLYLRYAFNDRYHVFKFK